VQHIADPSLDLASPSVQIALELVQKLNMDMPIYKNSFKQLQAELKKTLD
jgi:hypothetical protein